MPRARAAWLAALVACAASAAWAAQPNARLEAFRRHAQLRLAESALRAQDIDAAQERLQQALALAEDAAGAPDLAKILELLGDVHLRRHQLRTADSFYRRARVAEKSGRVAVRGKRYAQAAASYEQAVAANPARVDLYLRLGECLLRDKRHDEAKAAFDQAIERVPAGSLERAAVHESIARRYIWLARDAGAAAAYAAASLEIRKLNRAANPEQYARALRSGALRGADSMQAEELLQQLPASIARPIRAQRLQRQGDLERAYSERLAAVEQLRGAEPRSLAFARALEALAALDLELGHVPRAVSLWDEALNLRRESSVAALPVSLEVLGGLASTLERDSSPGAAEALLSGYLAELESGAGGNEPALAVVQERLGDVLLRQGRFDESSQRFQVSVQLRERAWGDGDARLQPVLRKLADALRRGGREEEARGAESQLALIGIGGPVTREPPQGRRDTGAWLSEPSGFAFAGLALMAATGGLAWLGWAAFARMAPAFEGGMRPAPARLPGAPSWRPIGRPQPRYPVSFRGRGGPLFGIWSVTMALTLVTLGLYFFWGKVRTRRYFWGQAEFAGDRFTFRGTGGELLIGWMKAAPVLALLLWGPGLLDLAWENPHAGLYGAGMAVTLLGALWPLAEVGANRYRLSRTSWRAIRFSFRGRPWPYMKIWLAGMPLWIATFGLWTPFFDTARRRYLVENTRFGDAGFTCDVHGRDLFAFYLVSWALLLPTAGASHFWYKALAERYYWSRTQLVHGELDKTATFECSLRGVDLLVLWIRSTAAIVITLGLGWPWTRVWQARLRLETLAMTGDFRPGRIRQSTDAAGAAGEGAADFLGLDFGFFA